MASHLSLTTVIFSLLRRYYIRVTEISRSMTSACCCCCDSPRDRSLTIRWNRIERYLFNPFRQRSILLEPRFYVPFRSNDSCIEFHTHLDSRKKKKKENVSESLLHTLEKEKFPTSSPILKIWSSKSKISVSGVFFFFENGETASRILENNTFQRFQNTSKYYYVINKDVPSGF